MSTVHIEATILFEDTVDGDDSAFSHDSDDDDDPLNCNDFFEEYTKE